MTNFNKFYTADRKVWRKWLEENFETAKEIWLVYPKKSAAKPKIIYNDAVEEALCFGWIDSTVRRLDDNHTMQRFSPRNPKSGYSQANKERMKWLYENQLLHESVREMGKEISEEEYEFPEDIIAEIKADEETWENYEGFSDSYKRIRIAYIDAARKRPEEFDKRLNNFIEKTREGKLIKGFGGIEKYY